MTKLPSLYEMTKILVETPSVSSLDSEEADNNRPALEHLATWLEDLGMHCDIIALPNSTKSYNLIARFADREPKLVYSGHVDTVPPSQFWQDDPFKLQDHQSYWQGLGVCDMKIFFPLFISAIKNLTKKNQGLPIGLFVTADEETTMDGARAVCEHVETAPQHIVIGEPTGLRPINAHKGYLAYRCTIKGKAGHASDPGAGHNAIEASLQFLNGLKHIKAWLIETFSDSSFKIPYPTLNVGKISGGSSLNTIADTCSIDFEVRPLPTMSLSIIFDKLQTLINQLNESDACHFHITRLYADLAGFKNNQKSFLIPSSESLCACTCSSVNFSTEASVFADTTSDIIILGPGDIAQAHQAQESIAVSAIERAENLYRKQMQDFLLRENTKN